MRHPRRYQTSVNWIKPQTKVYAWCPLPRCYRLLQTVYGKSRVLQVLLRMAADPTLAEDALVDLLMDVLADETPCPLSKKEACELVAVSRIFAQANSFRRYCDT